MSKDFTQAPIAVRHARLIGIIQEIQAELRFGQFQAVEPEADESVKELLEELHALVRSLQKQGADLTMIAE